MIHDVGIRWDSGETTHQKYIDIDKPKNLSGKRYIIDDVIPSNMFDSISNYVMGPLIDWNFNQGTVNPGDSDW